MIKLAFFVLLFIATSVSADTIELYDGRIVQCTVISRTDHYINVEVDGLAVRLAAKDVKRIIRGTSSAESVVGGGGDGRYEAKGEIAMGTGLIVRLNSTLDTSKDTAGQTFSALLEHALRDKGVIIVPAGSKIYGMITQSVKGIKAEEATRKKEQVEAVAARMLLTITQVNIEGKLLPLQTPAINPEAAKAPVSDKEQDGAGQIIILEGTLLEFKLGQALIH